ncbi:MAG: SAM-dependent methyltransferase, partial [Simkania negevensis]|nr:SAM-dependent methyltransferase [Simkania negevensis]
MTLFFISLGSALGLFFLLLYSTLRSGISPMPTSKKIKEALFAHLPAMQSGKKIIDLGSGWGNLVFPLSK